MVTVESSVESSDINEEYVLLIGGLNDRYRTLKYVFKFNGTWFPFGQLNKSRYYHNSIYDNSLVTIPSSDINEEYVLLIGGISDRFKLMNNVFKFNGTWFPFGQLNKPRNLHNSIYWNGAVYVIGGRNDVINDEKYNTKIEIWNIKDSPDHFKTKEKWPELNNWLNPHLFIVPDSFSPDR